MKSPALPHDVFAIIAAHADLSTVNALLRSCHALSHMRVKPARSTRPVIHPNITGRMSALSNGTRDGKSTYTRGHNTMTITHKRGRVVHWSATYTTMSVADDLTGPVFEQSRLCGVADSRAWLSMPWDISGQYIMRWAVTRRLAIDACPLTGRVWLSDALVQRKKQRRGDMVSTHRVFDERNRIDIAGLTAWMTDVAALIEPSLGVASDNPWASLRRTVSVVLRVPLDAVTAPLIATRSP